MKTAKGYVILDTTNWEEGKKNVHTYIGTLGNEIWTKRPSLKPYDPEMVESGYTDVYTDKTFDSRIEAIKVARELQKVADAVYRLVKKDDDYNCAIPHMTYKVIPVSKWKRVY